MGCGRAACGLRKEKDAASRIPLGEGRSFGDACVAICARQWQLLSQAAFTHAARRKPRAASLKQEESSPLLSSVQG